MTKVSILIITLLLSLYMATAHPVPVENSSKTKKSPSPSIRNFLNRLLLSASHVHLHSLEKGSERAQEAQTSSSFSFLRRLKKKKTKKMTTTTKSSKKRSEKTAAPTHSSTPKTPSPTPKPTLPKPPGQNVFTFQNNSFYYLTQVNISMLPPGMSSNVSTHPIKWGLGVYSNNNTTNFTTAIDASVILSTASNLVVPFQLIRIV